MTEPQILNEENTSVDYELRDEAGRQVAFSGSAEVVDGKSSWCNSHLTVLEDARKHVRPGLKLFKRVVSTTIEEIR
jgi:hypothetical protein